MRHLNGSAIATVAEGTNRDESAAVTFFNKGEMDAFINTTAEARPDDSP